MYKKQENLIITIVSHIQRNPVMGDTLMGITGWLREKERINCTTSDVASSLEKLLLNGTIKENVKFKTVEMDYKDKKCTLL